MKESVLYCIISVFVLLCGINFLNIGEWVIWANVGCSGIYLLVYYLYTDSRQEVSEKISKGYSRMAIASWLIVLLGAVAVIQRIFW